MSSSANHVQYATASGSLDFRPEDGTSSKGTDFGVSSSTTRDAATPGVSITSPGTTPSPIAPAFGVPLKAPLADPCTSYCAGGNPIYGFHPISNTAFGFGDARTTVNHAQMYVNLHAEDTTDVDKGSNDSSDESHVVSDWDRQMLKKYRGEGWTDGERESEFEGTAARKKNQGDSSDDSDSDDSDDEDTLATEDNKGRGDEESPLAGTSGKKNNCQNSDTEFENPGDNATPGSPFNNITSALDRAYSTMFSPKNKDSGKKDQDLANKSSWKDWFPMWMRCGKRNQ